MKCLKGSRNKTLRSKIIAAPAVCAFRHRKGSRMIKRIGKDTIQEGTMRYKRPERLTNDPNGFVGLQECQTLENGRWEGFVSVTETQAGFDRRLKDFKDLARKAGKVINGLRNNKKIK